MFGFIKKLLAKFKRRLKLVKRLKNRLFLKPPTYNIDPGYMYMDIYDDFPIYKFAMDINRSDEDEEFDIYELMFHELVATGDFEPINYEYNNEGMNAGKPSSEKNGNDIIYVDKFCLAKKDEPVMIYYEYGQLMVFTHLGIEKIDEIVEKYLNKYDQDDEKARCYIVVKNPNMYLESFDINLEGDLDFGLYNEGFDEIHHNIVDSIENDKNGLYILYGEAGTGKTTYIRHLIKECSTEKRKFVYVPAKLFENFTDPSILPFLLDNRGCIYIIEDCESLVTVEDGIRSDGISDLLNMTDGLLSDALDIKVICTFNTDYDTIDEALLRPGRCRCKYGFELLEKSRANAAAKKYGLGKVDEDVSLAVLFNPEKKFSEKKKRQKKIGF